MANCCSRRRLGDAAQAQQTIAKMAQSFAAADNDDYRQRLYDDTPIGPELRRQGVTSNLILSQKRATM